MKIQLARITRSRKGHPIRAERTIEADSLAVGRGAQCAIHLSDPRVALEHVTIFATGGIRRVAAVGAAALVVDGRLAGDLVLAPGARFEIGPYLFAVEEPPAGCDLALCHELVRPLPDGLSELTARSRFTLDAEGVSKRTMAWVAFIVIALLFLLVPIINAVMPPLRALTAALKISPDIVWNPGPLASGHAWLSYDCGACHQTPFLRVRDRACLACHEKMPGHVHDKSLQARLFGGTRCAECHVDHRGADEPVRADAGLCQTCHADIRHALAETALENVSDFAQAHPAFRLTLWRGPKPADVIRVKQTDKAQLVETSNLKFPHDAHLKPGLKGPEGRETLSCGSCHVPAAGDRRFVPIDMDRHCLRCHELRFEPAVTSRQVPHGSVSDAWLLLTEFYANISLGNVVVDTVDTGAIKRELPMASAAIVTDEQRQRALAFARGKARQVGIDLFEKRVCIVCHDVRRTNAAAQTAAGAMPWIVAPVHVAGTWMPKARFDHGKHRTAQTGCQDCHRVERSHKSGDVAIPDIGICRSCHAGNTAAPGKVVSKCISCHDYHLAAAPARPLAVPASSRNRP